MTVKNWWVIHPMLISPHSPQITQTFWCIMRHSLIQVSPILDMCDSFPNNTITRTAEFNVCYWLGKTQCCDVFLGVLSYKTHWCRISVLYFFLSGELLVYYIIVLQNNIIKWTLQNWLKGSTCELFVVNFFYLDV